MLARFAIMSVQFCFKLELKPSNYSFCLFVTGSKSTESCCKGFRKIGHFPENLYVNAIYDCTVLVGQKTQVELGRMELKY